MVFLKKTKLLFLSFLLIICSSCAIKIIEGNPIRGVKIHQYKTHFLQNNENIIIGKIKIIDEVGGISSPNQDIANQCQIIIRDNNDFYKDRSSIANSSLIEVDGFPNKGNYSNIYKGYFAIKVSGKDAYIYGFKCHNKYKLQQNLNKSEYYIKNNGELVTSYQITAKSYLRLEDSKSIYNIGSYVFAIKEPNDKVKQKEEDLKDLGINKYESDIMNKKRSFKPDIKITQYPDYQESALVNNLDLDFIKNLNKLPIKIAPIEFYELKINVKNSNPL